MTKQNNTETIKPKTHQGRTVSKTVRRWGFIHRRDFGELVIGESGIRELVIRGLVIGE